MPGFFSHDHFVQVCWDVLSRSDRREHVNKKHNIRITVNKAVSEWEDDNDTGGKSWSQLLYNLNSYRQTARAADARGHEARPRDSRARSRWSRHTKQSSLRCFHSGSLQTTGWICMHTERKILRLGENGFTAGLISVWYLDQGCKNKTGKQQKQHQQKARIGSLWSNSALSFWPFIVTPASGGNTRSPCCYWNGFTEEGGRWKCGGIHIIFFPSFSIVVSPFCWLFVLGDMAEQSYSWWVRIRPNGHPTIFFSFKKKPFIFCNWFLSPASLVAQIRIYSEHTCVLSWAERLYCVCI